MGSVLVAGVLFYTLLLLQGGSSRSVGDTNTQGHWSNESSLQHHTRRDYLRVSDTTNQEAEYTRKDLRTTDAYKDDIQGKPKDYLNYSSPHVNQMNPELNIFFTVEDLWVGKTLPIYFATKGHSTSPRLLPREKADSIPFSSSRLPYLLEYFGFSEDSPEAKAVENTLRQCELEPIKGERTFCAASLESMLDSTRGVFGMRTKFKVLTTIFLTESATLLQNYSISDTPKEISAPKMVACHRLPYPYAVYYCHCQESENKLFKVLLVGQDGTRIEAAAVCHMDTSQWDRDHAAFRVLHIRPGTAPVCHFFPADNLVWFPVSVL